MRIPCLRRPLHAAAIAVLPLALLGVATVAGQDPIISEFLAASTGGLLDEDGEAGDWIEIFNPSAGDVSLGGWSLTDDPDDPGKWVFPDVALPGHGFLIVFASGKDRRDPLGELHASFAIDRDGEYLGLARPDGSVASEFAPAFPDQSRDISFGRRVEVAERRLVVGNAAGRWQVPVGAGDDGEWTTPGFDDAAWAPATMGIGYDAAGPSGGEPVLDDATVPTDPIAPTSANSPAGEDVAKAIDGDPATKYLNFDTLGAGFTVTLSRGAAAVVGLRLTSANDASERDPASFVLSGSNDGTNFTVVASGAVPEFAGRFATVEVEIANAVPFARYRLVFPTVRDPAAAAAVQVAEVEFLAWIESGPVGGGGDVTAPGDAIVPTSFNSPAGEEVGKAIDDSAGTKYLNFDKLGAGFTVTPSGGFSVATGLRFTSANDAPERDPTSYALSGSNDGVNFVAIASGGIPDFAARFAAVEVAFPNRVPYRHYRLLFPTVRNAGAAVAVQVAEVEILGQSGVPEATFGELIGTAVPEGTGGARVRIPFVVEAGGLPQVPALRVWYDDGFVAYLNGSEVARSNAPAGLTWDARALADRPRGESVRPERFDLSAHRHLFAEGRNILAVQALNDADDSPEFLLRAEIVETSAVVGDAGYFTTPSPGAANSDAITGFVDAPIASVERGLFDGPFDLELSSVTEGAEIRYTTDGSVPAPGRGSVYAGPLRIAATTVLRAAAFRDGWQPSPVTTLTYLFPGDVVRQSRDMALAAGLPATWGGQGADYGLDPRVPVQPSELATLPSISLVMEAADMFGSNGIYANPTARGDSWEREVSFEWIVPDGVEGGSSFQEQAGLRIQGGAFRRFDLSLKKSFRLVFRERYGTPRLRHSLFGPDAAPEADSIVLRANGNDAWRWGGGDALYIRDAFAMESMRAMGNVASHSTFAHLYINGQYWGLYNPAERPDAAFSSIYHGGDADDWDALNQDSVPDGNADAWNRLLTGLSAGLASDANYQRIQGNNPDGTRNPDHEVLLDVDNMIDYMILNFYIGNQDWPQRNHWYGRNRTGEQGFQFYPWDSETAMGLGSGLTTNRLGVSESVARPYAAARANAEFRVRFGDRVQRHFFNGGAFAVDPASPAEGVPARRFAALADRVEAAIAGESARWGDQLGSTPFTREAHWRPERDSLLNGYFPQRSAVVLDQFRAAGLYPNTDAPVFSQHGGRVPAGFLLAISAPEGTILYTLDGSDPRAPGSVEVSDVVELVGPGADRRVLVPAGSVDPAWRSDAGFDDREWAAGSGAIGYEEGAGYEALIALDVNALMRGINGSALVRIPFDHLPGGEGTPNFMTLRARFDDGFVAWLNGRVIASANAPADPAWNATATASHNDTDAVQWREFDVSAAIDALVPGRNVLAVQAMNVSTTSSDFLFDAELEAGVRTVDGGDALVYSGPIVLDDLATVRARALESGEWSALVEATFVVGNQRLVVSELDYHPSPPTVSEAGAGFLDPDDFEFIELHNPGAHTLDLSGARFTDGVDFVFPDDPGSRIPPGGRVVLVSNPEAFAFRYGSAPAATVAGRYDGRFSNAGERVEIVDREGTVLVSFTYDDVPPWPEAADGGGASLELPDAEADPAVAGNWRASVDGPSPGAPASTVIAPGEVAITLAGGEVVIRFAGVAGRSYRIESADGLTRDGWQVADRMVPAVTGPVEARIAREAGRPNRFFRVVAE